MLTLDGIAANPELVQRLSAQEAARLAALAASLAVRLNARAVQAFEQAQEDKYITAREAAAMLGQEVSWLYRHAHKLPFVHRHGGSVRCSLRAMREYLAGRE